MIQNHDFSTGKTIYRYPAIQFKLLDHSPAIFGFDEEGVRILKDIFISTDELVIREKTKSILFAIFF